MSNQQSETCGDNFKFTEDQKWAYQYITNKYISEQNQNLCCVFCESNLLNK